MVRSGMSVSAAWTRKKQSVKDRALGELWSLAKKGMKWFDIKKESAGLRMVRGDDGTFVIVGCVCERTQPCTRAITLARTHT